MFVVQYLGDISGWSSHLTLDSALAKIESDFPARWEDRGTFPYTDENGTHMLEDKGYEGTPDPEDDRIVVWKCEPPQMIPVWHFSGWHWDPDEFNLPQGKLPGHDKSLYEEAMSEY